MTAAPAIDVPDHADTAAAWRVAVGAAIASGTGFGTTYTFGAFFDAMSDDFGSGRGATALVFGITLLLFFGLGIVSGPLADRVGARRLAAAGAVLIAASLAATSQVDSVVAGYVTYGLGVGLGGGLIVTPMFSVVGGWFVRRRAVAMGLVASGNGLGTLLLVPWAESAIATHGWRSAYLRLAVIDLVLFGIATALVARPPVFHAPPPAIAHMRAALRTREFQVFFLVGLLFGVSLFVAFAFVVDFATDDGISSDRAALLVGIIGATSIVGRLGITALSSRVRSVSLLIACLAAQPVAFTLWFLADGSYPVLVAFAVTMGIAYGGFVGLGPEVTAALFGVVGLGGLLGLQFLSAGLGGLLGPTIAGFLSDASDGRALPIGFALGVSVVTLVVATRLPREPVEISAG